MYIAVKDHLAFSMLIYYMQNYSPKWHTGWTFQCQFEQQVMIETCFNILNTLVVTGEFLCCVGIYLHWKLGPWVLVNIVVSSKLNINVTWTVVINGKLHCTRNMCSQCSEELSPIIYAFFQVYFCIIAVQNRVLSCCFCAIEDILPNRWYDTWMIITACNTSISYTFQF